MTTFHTADERASLVRRVTDRVATRLVESIEADEADEADEAHDVDWRRGGATLAGDARRQQLMVGAWLSDELAVVNQDRMRRGEPPLPEVADRDIRSRVVAELTGSGPLEPFMG